MMSWTGRESHRFAPEKQGSKSCNVTATKYDDEDVYISQTGRLRLCKGDVPLRQSWLDRNAGACYACVSVGPPTPTHFTTAERQASPRAGRFIRSVAAASTQPSTSAAPPRFAPIHIFRNDDVAAVRWCWRWRWLIDGWGWPMVDKMVVVVDRQCNIYIIASTTDSAFACHGGHQFHYVGQF